MATTGKGLPEIEKNRFGKFSLSHLLLISDPETYKEILNNCVIVSAVSHYGYKAIEYEGYSMLFDECEKCSINTYHVEFIIKSNEEGYTTYRGWRFIKE